MAKYILNTRDLFLRSICAIYMFAFSSLYIQIPGLYGETGILPAHTQLPEKTSPIECFSEKKTLLCFSSFIGLNTAYMMELLALIGTSLAFVGLVWKSWCNSLLFFILWSFYLSLYRVGQIFLWYQWDILLLEVGFLTMFIAPFGWNYKQTYKPRNIVTMWLLKWALFRLMFASGVVKLQSGCPTWWGLTAMSVHYESQCLPTPVAWLFHLLPDWCHKLCIVLTYVIEIAIPFLFFSPVREHRYFAFISQVFFQVLIILTGNYNFFNLTTIAMCFSLVDDIDLGYRRSYGIPTGLLVSLKSTLTWSFKWIGYAALTYCTCIYFGLKLIPDGSIDSEISFTKAQFTSFMEMAVPVSIIIGSISLLLSAAEALTSSLFEIRGNTRKIRAFSSTLIYSLLSLTLFGVSLVPYTVLDKETNVKVWPVFKYMYAQSTDFEISSSYGLFRRMTGVGGRPEVILEGANSLEGPWTAYEFYAKPGQLDSAPSFIVPHQPRVDWQMWFAALGTYQQNPWLVSMTHRLLSGEKQVTKFLHKDSPWRETPPKYIRGLKYIYHYTSFNDTSGNWWRRKLEGEYMPVFSVDHKPLLDYLKKLSYIGGKDTGLKFDLLATGLDCVRSVAEIVEPHLFIWGLLFGALIIIYTTEHYYP